MHNIILLFILTIAICFPVHAEESSLDNPRLLQLFEADQNARSSDQIDWKVLSGQDRTRRQKTMSIIKNDGLHTAGDYYHAAMVFQHGDTADEIRTAFGLAWMASVLDPENKGAKWLSAAAWDRIMMRENMPQWYGTQFFKVGQDASWELYKIDESAVTDEERARMNVPPLKEARERARKMNE